MSKKTTNPNLAAWHEYTVADEPEMLHALLADDAVFHSPVVHTPQKGRAIVFAYLRAASHVLGGANFEYTREFDCGNSAVLEFRTEIDGTTINGIDMIEWNDEGKIIDFKVMVRPLQAVNKIHTMMGEMLERQAKAKAKA